MASIVISVGARVSAAAHVKAHGAMPSAVFYAPAATFTPSSKSVDMTDPEARAEYGRVLERHFSAERLRVERFWADAMLSAHTHGTKGKPATVIVYLSESAVFHAPEKGNGATPVYSALAAPDVTETHARTLADELVIVA